MGRIQNCFILLCVLGILLTGCYHKTTVILPPETASSTTPSHMPTTQPPTAPTTLPATVPTTEPATEPTTGPASDEATTEPTTESTAVPTTKPTTAPTTKPTTEPTSKPTTPSLSDHVIGSLEREISQTINSRRTTEGLPELKLRKQLSAIATIRARECVRSCSSTRPDGRNWSSVLTDYDSSGWDHTAEIRIYCSKGLPADIIVDTWMNSDSASTRILSSKYRYCGIGVADSGATSYIVIIFTG